MKLIFMAFLFLCIFNGNFAAPNVMEHGGCIDRMETCALIVDYDLCQRQAYYRKYCCTSCGGLEPQLQGGEIDYQ